MTPSFIRRLSANRHRTHLFILAGALTLLAAVHFFRSEDASRGTIWLPDGKIERCLVCHNDVPDPSSSHPIEIFGCSTCHLGDPLATDKERAHLGMIVNAGSLDYAFQTCGQAACHSRQVYRVLNGVMATNSGFIASIAQRFGDDINEKGTRIVGIEDLLNDPSLSESRSVQLFAKLCGSCHLWKKRGTEDDDYSQKGGGCSACHRRNQEKHSAITVKIENEQCLRCHNRSGRIGLTYSGMMEESQSGTPFTDGIPSHDIQSGNRFMTRTLSDIHHEKRMLCIDCHTDVGVMGDGFRYSRKRDQIDIACDDCHGNGIHTPKSMIPDDTIRMRIRLQTVVTDLSSEDQPVIVTKKGSPLYHVRPRPDGTLVLVGKNDGKERKISVLKRDSIHDAKIHERLRCQPCHSLLTPQCYGCHISFDPNAEQFNHLTQKTTPGSFNESRDFARYTDPIIGVDEDNRIMTVVPGMHIDYQNQQDSGENFTIVRYATLAAHSTRKESRSCMSCHLSTRTLGRGSGSFIGTQTDSGEANYAVNPLLEPTVFPSPDGWCSGRKSGSADPDAATTRCLNDEELNRIVDSARCALCHSDWKDSIYRDFKESREKFWSGKTTTCPAAIQRKGAGAGKD